MNRFLLALLLVLACDALALEPGKSGILAIDTLPNYEWDVATKHNSLAATLALGALFPGGSQYYTGHYVRGGFLTALELGLAVEVFVTKPWQQDRRFEQAKKSQDSVAYYNRRLVEDPYPDSISAWSTARDRNLTRVRSFSDKKMTEEDLRRSELAWLVGLHVYGLMDGYGIWRHNQGRKAEKRETWSSVWRAMVVPGWGQLYNDEYGKAGMLYMAAIGSTASYFSRQQMVEYYLQRLQTARAEGRSSAAIAEIQEELTFFRKKRNQYIWGMTLFYFYSIADAAVDAMLSDFDSPLHWALAPTPEGLAAQASWDF